MGTLAGFLIWGAFGRRRCGRSRLFIRRERPRPADSGAAALLLVTCRVGFPARWASRVDPVVALRAE